MLRHTKLESMKNGKWSEQNADAITEARPAQAQARARARRRAAEGGGRGGQDEILVAMQTWYNYQRHAAQIDSASAGAPRRVLGARARSWGGARSGVC